MLVLWDPSWTERLWCLFELAAFLKSRKGREQKLTVRPTFFGPCSIVVFALVQAACVPLITAPIDGDPGNAAPAESTFLVLGVVLYILGQVAVKFMRNYFYSIETLKEQLRNISFDKTRSSCCDMNHVNASGQRMPCDRVIVKQCASIWFGSEAAFEESVRSTVLDTLTTELQFRVFSRTWTMGVAVPALWTFLDLTASWSSHSANEAGPFLIEGLTIWLLAAPALADAQELTWAFFCLLQRFFSVLSRELARYSNLWIKRHWPRMCGCYCFGRALLLVALGLQKRLRLGWSSMTLGADCAFMSVSQGVCARERFQGLPRCCGTL